MKTQFRPNPIGKCLYLKDLHSAHSVMNGGQAVSLPTTRPLACTRTEQ